MDTPTTDTPETFKPCEPEDLTQMTIPQIIAFAIKALNDAPVSQFTEGNWLSNFSDLQNGERHHLFALPEGCRTLYDVPDSQRDLITWRPAMQNPEHVRFCAVGAVLAADGARAAFDWLTVGDTHRWKAGPAARLLFNSLSNVFECAGSARRQAGDGKALALMAAKIGICVRFLNRIQDRIDPTLDYTEPSAIYALRAAIDAEYEPAQTAIWNATDEMRNPPEQYEPEPEPEPAV